MRKLLIYLLAVLAVFVGVVCLVLFTSTGLGVVTRAIPYLTGGAVTIEKSGGRIADQWWLSQVKIHAGDTEVTVQEIRADWQLYQLFQGNVQAQTIFLKEIEVILPQPDPDSNEDETVRIELPIIGLPIALLVDELIVDGAVVRRVDTAQPVFVLESLSLQVKARDDRFVINELTLTTPELETSLSGTLQLSKDWPIDIRGTWSAGIENYAPVNGTIALLGSVGNPEFRVETSDPFEVTLDGAIATMFDVPSWKMHGTIKQANPIRLQDELPDLEMSAVVDSAGTIDNYKASITGTLESSDYPQADIDLQVSGTQYNLAVDSGTIASTNSEAIVSAAIDWQQKLLWEAQVELADLDLSSIIDQHVGTVSFSAHSVGTYNNGNLLYDVELKDFVGKNDQLSQDVLAEMKLSGDDTGLKIVSADIGIGDGHVRITGELAWPGDINWDARAVLTSIDPSIAGAAVEGSINADVHSSGRVSESEIEGGVQLDQIAGMLAGYELSGGGNLSYTGGDIHFENVYLKNGRNNLEIDGSIADRFDLTFSLDGAELNRLLPSLKGTLAADGRLTGTREHPALTASIQGDNLAYHEYKAGKIVADFNVSGQKNGTIDASVEAQHVVVAEQQVSGVTASLTGTIENHHLELSIDSSEGTAQLETIGSLIENSSWDGQINMLKVEHPLLGTWQNRSDSPLQISSNSVTLGDLCIDSADVNFCGTGTWNQGTEWSFTLSDMTIDLMALHRWELSPYSVRGVLKADADISADGSQLSALAANITLDELVLETEDNAYYEQLKWVDSSLIIDLDDNNLNAEVSSRFIDDSYIKGILGIRNFGDLSASLVELPLEGSLKVAIEDLTPLKVVTGTYLEPRGKLSADLSVAGSIGDPRLKGDITLGDGEIYIPQLNITPKDVNLSINANEESVSIDLETVSGEGTARAEGLFEFDQDGWAGNLRIVAEAIELINLKEIEIIADADLLLKLDGDGGRLEGALVIPKALIQPEEMTGSITESDDVKMIGKEEETDGWPFDLAVKIELGDDVRVDGYGLSGNLRGSIDLANTEKQYLAGHGELYLDDGMISVYERQLKITRGRVLFDGGPVDNPGLDVSARKTIAAEQLGREDIVVGVNLIGTIDDFEMDLFSIPSMDDADIISYIVVGTSLGSSGDGEGGAVGAALGVIGMNKGNKILGTVGGAFAVDDLKIEGKGSSDTSLVVGKKLMEDLYISYDFNLYKNAGFFRIRYDFGKGFSIESKNSIESNGLNLLYSIER